MSGTQGKLKTPYFIEPHNPVKLSEGFSYEFIIWCPKNISNYKNISLVVDILMDFRHGALGQKSVTFKNPTQGMIQQ